MASKKATSESNMPLIVTLVFFVLTTITLGVLVFMAYGKHAELEQAAKSASDSATASKRDMEKERYERLLLRRTVGIEETTAPATMNGLKSSNQAVFDQIRKQVEPQAVLSPDLQKILVGDTAFTWDPAQDAPNNSLHALINKLAKQIDDLKKETGLKDTQKADAKAATDTTEAGMRAEIAKLDEARKKAEGDHVATQGKKGEEYLALDKKLNDISVQLNDLRDAKQRGEGLHDRAAADLNRKLEGLRTQLQIAKSKVEPPNSLEKDLPKGEILRVERSQTGGGSLFGLAYINLGSADNVKPQLTFSILPSDATGRSPASRERKGALEVVNVLGPHLCNARFTSLDDEITDPPLVGDLLFNPAWNPSQREHIAIAGVIDLDQDGHDDTPEVVRTLEKMGIVVDAYLDMKSRSIKGPGMTEGTTYLVLGNRLTISDTLARDANNPITAGMIEVNTKIGELEAIAKEKGVQTVAYRRFLSLVGYKLPKAIQSLDLSNTSYIRGTGGNIKAPGEPKPK